MTVSTTAGMQGCYMYDMETGVETYLPPLTNVEHNKVFPATGELLDEQPSPRWIIGGVDNRMIVKNPTGEMATICLLGIRHGSGEDEVGHGTGWLINKNHIVTAGHCLYDDRWETSNPEDKHYAQHVAVYVGASGGKFSQYRLAKKLFAGRDYRENNYPQSEYEKKGKFDDWGVITLDSPVSNNSFMGLRAVNSASEMASRYTTAGYPLDKNEDLHSRWDDYDMYWTNGTILGDLPQPRYLDVVRTDIDIMKGQSGSPVYTYRNSSDGYCAEAIVVAVSADPWDDSNHLVLINDWLFTELTTRYS